MTQLSCFRHEQEVFSNLTFNLLPGMLIQLQGLNGSGKSSLLKMLAGLLPIERGVISWQSNTICTKQTLTGLLSEDPPYLSNILYIGHKTGLTLALTPKENLMFWYQLRLKSQSLTELQPKLPSQIQCHYGKIEKTKTIKTVEAINIVKKVKTVKAVKAVKSIEKIEILLNTFELSSYADIPCEELSAGQKQKVVLARLWLEQATVWLLDEPFNALDKKMSNILEEKFIDYLKTGGCIILANHATLTIQNKLADNFKVIQLSKVYETENARLSEAAAI